MKDIRRRKRGKRAAQATALLGGFFALAGTSSDGFAVPYEYGTTTTIVCGSSITTNTVPVGAGYGEGYGDVTIVVSEGCNPTALLAFLNANFQTLAGFYGNISNYMEMFRSGIASAPATFDAYKPGAPTFQVASASDLAGVGPSNNRPLFLAQAPSAVFDGSKFAVWAYGTGAWGHVAADGNAPGYRHTTGGVLAGFDWQTENWLVGAHAGYAHSTIKVRDDGSNVSISHAIVGVHGALRWNAGQFGRMYLDGIFNVGFLDHDVTQSLTTLGFPGTQATGGPGGYSIGGKLELGTQLHAWGFDFNPYVALQVAHISTDSYTLTSSAANLLVGDVDTTSVRLTLAAQVGKRFSFADGSSLKVNVRGGWIAELADSNQSTTISALGGAVSFNAVSNDVGRNFALVGGSMQYQMLRNFGILFDYRAEMNNRSTTHALLGGVRFTW